MTAERAVSFVIFIICGLATVQLLKGDWLEAALMLAGLAAFVAFTRWRIARYGVAMGREWTEADEARRRRLIGLGAGFIALFSFAMAALIAAGGDWAAAAWFAFVGAVATGMLVVSRRSPSL